MSMEPRSDRRVSVPSYSAGRVRLMVSASDSEASGDSMHRQAQAAVTMQRVMALVMGNSFVKELVVFPVFLLDGNPLEIISFIYVAYQSGVFAGIAMDR